MPTFTNLGRMMKSAKVRRSRLKTGLEHKKSYEHIPSKYMEPATEHSSSPTKRAMSLNKLRKNESDLMNENKPLNAVQSMCSTTFTKAVKMMELDSIK